MNSCPHCGVELPKSRKPRSVEQHRRYFKIIKHAFEQWPESHDFQPENAEHLRKWAQCKAGGEWRVSHKIEINRTDPRSLAMAQAAVAAAMKALGDYCWIVPHHGALVVTASKSIAFEKLSHLAFCALSDAVSEVIEAETGISIADLLPPMPERATEAA